MMEELKNIRKTFNLYASTLGILVLAGIISRYNLRFNLVQEKMKIFGFVVYPEYVSAIIGILFGTFAVVLYLQVRLLRIGLQRYDTEASDDSRQAAIAVMYFPWVSSPFHKSNLGGVLFWCSIGFGCAILAWVSIAHILLLIKTGNETAFRMIGYFDLGILIVSLIVLWLTKNSIREVRRLVTSMVADQKL